MRSSYFNAVLFSLSLWMPSQHAHAQVEMDIYEAEIFAFDEITSSLFEIVLYPTPRKLDDSATSKVTNIIKDQLMVSSSNQNSDSSFQTIDIFVEEVNFDEYYQLEESLPSGSYANNSTYHVEASLLEFKVVLAFHNQDQTSTPPSRFALDNLVVRTFSQPSTKSNFIVLITQTWDPSLIAVEDIGINLVEDFSNEKNAVERDTTLSGIDIILIIISSGIFIAIFYILFTQYRKDGYLDIWEEDSVKGKNDDDRVDEEKNIGSNDTEKPRVPLEKVLNIQGNIVEAGSIESSIDSQSQIVLSVVNDSPAVSYASTTSSSSSSSSSTYTSSSKNDSLDEATEARSEISGSISMNSESVKSEDRHDSKVSTIIKDDLASKLLRLPGSDAYARRLKPNPIYSSVASAPTILEDIIGKWKNEDLKNIRSIRSNRSTASPKGLKLSNRRKKASLISLHPKLNNRFVLNGFLMLGNTEEFHKSWLESQRKALEDIDEGSVEDVFHIDAQSTTSGTIETRDSTRRSSSTPVSEWMKLVRVVNSASETQSSLENSSIEPKVFLARESSSIDLSLEDSLAKSSVDPEVI